MSEVQAFPSKGKNIMVCCDGTGNRFMDDPDADDSNSNVVKLYTALRIDNDQVGYYHPGVGTADSPAAHHWITRKWSLIKGLAFAEGFAANVLDAYQYLMRTYNDGDRIYLFGFSRGSYTVRALAGLLDGYGLLCSGNEGHLPYAWNDYLAQHVDPSPRQTRVVPNHRFKETFSRKDLRIHFMGIWDTVSSVGWINTPLRLFSVSQNPTIRTGRHAISIDERRCFYRDNLWEEADPTQMEEVTTAAHPAPSQDLLQVWFAGVHSDVGGSYPQKESVLSNVALRWLMKEACKAGAQLKPQMEALVLGDDYTILPAPPEPPVDPEILDDLGPLYRKPTVSKLHKSLHGFGWWFLELLPHRYYDKDESETQWRTPLGMPRRVPPNSHIHKSVRDRIHGESIEGVSMAGQPRYTPVNLIEAPDSLHPTDVPSQPAGTIFLYQPKDNPKPRRNEAFIRIGTMVTITAAEIAIVLAVPISIFLFFRRR